ncbi:hypothetical protein ACQJBY_052519 [Aegilops geniculata]
MASPATPTPALIRPRASRSRSQLGAVSLASDHAAATASSGRRRDFVFVVNPSGANGRTGKQWKQLLPFLHTRLADQCNICECITSGPSHAIDVTREAIKDGADAVIAVGGDGTLHEVVNGFFWKGSPVRALDRGPDHLTALGLIPLGTGSDFARTFGWSNDPRQAIDRIVRAIQMIYF